MKKLVWCVVDFEDHFILVRIAKRWPNGEMHYYGDFIVDGGNFAQNQERWIRYNESFYDGPCPFMDIEKAVA